MLKNNLLHFLFNVSYTSKYKTAINWIGRQVASYNSIYNGKQYYKY